MRLVTLLYLIYKKNIFNTLTMPDLHIVQISYKEVTLYLLYLPRT